jgi:CheY-like chemotaxis protein
MGPFNLGARSSKPVVYTFVHFQGTNVRLQRDIHRRACGEMVLEELLILVIEDDEVIQAMIDEALCEGGYKPAVASSGEEAITLLRGEKIKYRVLVTDINLAGKIDGWEVARAAREINPAFPVVYMTGAAADQWAVQGVPNSILMAKPFAPAQLVTAISNLLNAAGPPLSPGD